MLDQNLPVSLATCLAWILVPLADFTSAARVDSDNFYDVCNRKMRQLVATLKTTTT